MDHNKLWEILTEMRIPDHLTCLLRNLYQVKKEQLELDIEWFQIGKMYIKAVYCHSAYLTYMQSMSCEMLGWMKIARRNINNFRYADDTTLMTESQEPPDEKESEKVGLKLNIPKTKIMASCAITSWQIDGETMETVSDFIFGGLQNHCRW